MTWRVDIENRSSVTQISDLPFKALTVNWVLNAPGAVDLTLNPYDALMVMADLNPGEFQLAVYRNSTRIWAGYIWGQRVGMAQNKDHTLSLTAEGYYSALRSRVVTSDLIYNNQLVQDIMWGLIDHTQTKTHGNLGLTQGLHSGGSQRIDRDYCALEYPIISDSIDEIVSLDDGCDWAIGPNLSYANDKLWRTYQPRRGSDLSGSVTIDQSQISRMTYEINGSTLANLIYNSGTDDCNPPVEITEDTTSQTTYGLMEAVQQLDQSKKRDLIKHGDRFIRNYKNPSWTAEVTYFENNGPALGAFDVGDRIALSDSTGFSTFSKTMRCMSIQADVTLPDTTFVTATLDSVVD